MDTGTSGGTPKYVWYEQGFNAAKQQSGLPLPEVPFRSQSHTDHWYSLASYTNSNVILITTKSTETRGTLTLSAPQLFSNLSFLVSAAGGAVNLNAIVHHADETTQTNTIRVEDWNQAANPVWTAHGRFDIATQKFDSFDTNRWRLYSQVVTLTNPTSPVTRVEFVRRPNQIFGNAAIFGVSGSTGGDYTPVAVTGFNHDVVIEKEYPLVNLPNLRGNVFSFRPLVSDPGEALVVPFQFLNNGSASSSNAVVAVYLRPRGAMNDEAYRVGEILLSPLEPTGVPINVSFDFTVPTTLPLGLYEVSFRIDPGLQIEEVTESDNEGFAFVELGPNLSALGMTTHVRTNELGSEIFIQTEIMNSGSPVFGSRVHVNFGDGSTNDFKVAEVDLPEMWTSRRYPLELSFAVPAGMLAGTYRVTVQLDALGVVSEWNETDNSIFAVVEISSDGTVVPSAVSITENVEANEDSGPIRIPYSISGFNLDRLKQTLTYPIQVHPFGPAAFEVNGTNRVLVIPLRPDQSGQGTFMLTVEDGSSAVTKSISITVLPVNDPVNFQPVPDQLIGSGVGPVSIPLDVHDPDTPPGELTASVVNSASDLFVTNGIAVKLEGGEWMLVLTPMIGKSGNADFTVTISDGLTAASQSFRVSVILPELALVLTDLNLGRFKVSGAASIPVQLQSSTSLVDWSFILTNSV